LLQRQNPPTTGAEGEWVFGVSPLLGIGSLFSSRLSSGIGPFDKGQGITSDRVSRRVPNRNHSPNLNLPWPVDYDYDQDYD